MAADSSMMTESEMSRGKALCEACSRGDVDKVKDLLDKTTHPAFIHFRDKNGCTSIHHASNGKATLISMLLEVVGESHR